MPRVVFVNRFYWPEEPATAQLLHDLAEGLAARGHAVTVVAARPANRMVPRTQTHNGVTIDRLASTCWGRDHLLGRLVDYLTFEVACCWYLLRRLRRGDSVVAMTDPALIGVAVWPATKLKSAALLHWVQDIYPEIATTVTGHRLPLLLRPLRDWVWRHSAACVVPGTDMAALVREHGVAKSRVFVSPNWAPAGLAPASAEAIAARREEWGLSGNFVLAYSGNLGRVHDLTPLVELAAALHDDPAITFLIVGHGAQRPRLETLARERRLTNLRFLPPQPREQLALSLGIADVHFVTLRPRTGRCVFPSKLYGIARAERPVVFIGDRNAEVARLVRERGFGLTFERTEIITAAEAVHALRRQPERIAAMRLAAREFGAEGGLPLALATWQSVLAPKLAVPVPTA
ncbi:glycosyltransferase family 4 protein [Opitutus terrae]|uniref:Glycosyl transferase group 1 n=1 Tax=Opitutus terrae (strain DSM 11246 / JCM 15787 / PB90-1) TaxID=452637 RepID=B1ZW15_OPITP|nr:glycosyltransferase family 4 protein [Opitutus terrae]ACB76029.1 glycosyl transferase group 1 [Opitutus terrae PB90-1]